MMKDQIDYSLYLVTDSTEAILGSRDLTQVVEQALLGGWWFLPLFYGPFRIHRTCHNTLSIFNNDSLNHN